MSRTASFSARVRNRQRWLAAVFVVTSTLSAGRLAHAQEAASAPAEASDSRREQAKQHFERGLELARQSGNWEAALAEFLTSRSIYPTRSATRNAAIALRELGRNVEAYELSTRLIEEFSGAMSPEELESAKADRTALEALIGRLEIAVKEPGASLSIDGRPRGTTPLAAPVAVEPGTHVVRVSKDGFEPYELTVAVSAGSHVSMGQELRPLDPHPPSGVATQPPVPAPAAPPPERPLRFFAEYFLGGVLASSVNGDADQNCNCSENSAALGFLTGARIGYLPLERLGVELSGGYFSIRESMTRNMVAEPDDPFASSFRSSDYADSTRLSGPFAALTASYRWFEQIPVTVRAGFGVALLSSHTENSGTFKGTLQNPDNLEETQEFTTPMSIEEAERRLATPFGTTEARLGYRFSRTFSADFGVAVLLLFPKEGLRVGTSYFTNSSLRQEKFEGTGQAWADDEEARPGVLSLPEEKVAGPFLAFVPSLALRAAF